MEDSRFRLIKYVTHFLNNFARMYKLREPDESMIQLYVNQCEGTHLSHLVNSFTICYEEFKNAGRYPSPDEILSHAAEEKRLIKNQKSGPLEVFEGNRQMLQVFIKAFRESNLKGQDLTDHLMGVIDKNYDRLCEAKPKYCRRCNDQGWYRAWFLRFPGVRTVHQKSADGKLRPFFELNRVPSAPIWIQEERPDVDVPEGQLLEEGICRCECSRGEEFSFPRMEEIPS